MRHISAAGMLVAVVAAIAPPLAPESTPELRFCLRADPKTLDPLLANEEASTTISYLTQGVLIRLNRSTQKLEPELATSWQVRQQGARIDFTLRSGVRFSDGTPFTSDAVVATVGRLAGPDLHSAIADTFRFGGRTVRAVAHGPGEVSVFFSAPVGGIELLFDQLPISPKPLAAPAGANPSLGPFVVGESKSGQYVVLHRNPYYWKRDSAGARLPYVGSIRLAIQANRDIEALRFRRGELHLIEKLEADSFERLRKETPAAVRNAGPSLDPEFLWFNQSPRAGYPAHKRQWFQSASFRRAISAAINRYDIGRLVYLGHAHAAAGPVSEANKLWFNSRLKPQPQDAALARKLLETDGFHLNDGVLRDRNGNIVEFSLITNASSATRVQIGTIVQQDLAKVGIRLNFVPMEFQSLVERILVSQQYEACLLGLTNTDVDPNGQLNVYLSSGTHHAWNPEQTAPATAWESEIDKLMKAQSTATSFAARKAAFDRVQEIMAEQAAIVYLVYPDVLLGIAPSVRGVEAAAVYPHTFWNIERLSFDDGGKGAAH